MATQVYIEETYSILKKLEASWGQSLIAKGRSGVPEEGLETIVTELLLLYHERLNSLSPSKCFFTKTLSVSNLSELTHI